MLTEHISPRFVDLDSWSTADMIAAMYDGQLAACAAVKSALPAIKRLARRSHRFHYGWRNSSATAERRRCRRRRRKRAEAIADAEVNEHDVVIAVAASGTTPFTIGALRAAGARGALSIAVANNRGAPLFELARHRILIETGTEVLAGSTRMQAGTAQKIVLNLFSTAVMVKLGRVYRGLMVSMRASNTKLLRRAEVIVSQIVGCAENDAVKFVQRAEGDVKVAVLLGLGWGQTDAIEALRKHEGNLRSVIDKLTHDPT
jgi:N-acetylmuramic acid 6-phosphate etherase